MFRKTFWHKKTFLIAAAGILLAGSVVIYAFARAAASENVSQESGTDSTDPSSSPSTGEVPAYKLQESIRLRYRPDWVWDEEKQDYSNLGDLVRDPETGLFPEPSPFPEDLMGRATWDSYLGLYVRNSIHINHETGEITQDTSELINTKEDWPIYDQNVPDKFNNGYSKYYYVLLEEYDNHGPSSIACPDLDLFEREGFTPEWFGLTLNDLPMIFDKLEAGAPTSYAMSLILLMTKADVGIRPSPATSQTILAEWVTVFNALTSGAREQVKQGKLEGLGYLALPFIYDELISGNDSLLSALPEQADGLEGADKADTASWNKEDWLAWFKDNAETMEIFRYVCQRTLNMPWLGYDDSFPYDPSKF